MLISHIVIGERGHDKLTTEEGKDCFPRSRHSTESPTIRRQSGTLAHLTLLCCGSHLAAEENEVRES